MNAPTEPTPEPADDWPAIPDPYPGDDLPAQDHDGEATE